MTMILHPLELTGGSFAHHFLLSGADGAVLRSLFSEARPQQRCSQLCFKKKKTVTKPSADPRTTFIPWNSLSRNDAC